MDLLYVCMLLLNETAFIEKLTETWRNNQCHLQEWGWLGTRRFILTEIQRASIQLIAVYSIIMSHQDFAHAHTGVLLRKALTILTKPVILVPIIFCWLQKTVNWKVRPHQQWQKILSINHLSSWTNRSRRTNIKQWQLHYIFTRCVVQSWEESPAAYC